MLANSLDALRGKTETSHRKRPAWRSLRWLVYGGGNKTAWRSRKGGAHGGTAPAGLGRIEDASLSHPTGPGPSRRRKGGQPRAEDPGANLRWSSSRSTTYSQSRS